MAKEIERKYIVTGMEWSNYYFRFERLFQGYLTKDSGLVTRVRTTETKAWLTIKTPNKGITRDEYEYEIPLLDARAIMDHLPTSQILRKIRHSLHFAGKIWTVDVFEGSLTGLVMAEIELNSETEQIVVPHWVGQDVSTNPRFYNSNLVGKKLSDLIEVQ